MPKIKKQKDQMGDMGRLYDQQAVPFADRSGELVWWLTIGKPAFDRHLSSFYNRSDLKILDLGCASGRIEAHLAGKGIPLQSFTGIDISSDQIKIAQNRFPEVKFIVGDITNVQLPLQKFDLAISNMVLEFLNPDQLEQAMNNTFDSLKPKGTFFFITTHPDKMRVTSGLKKPGIFTVQFPWGSEGPNYYRTLEDFKQAIDKASFVVDVLEELNVPPEAKKIDPKEYARYKQYSNTRLIIKASKRSNP
ncbi:hypothetical protein A3J20_07160 [Candidatus Gottesmanbacteria bacterium RIFCSPLOWO2_02_FULL_42_29]|uniref:Methyltransferase domain-containing protein n=1 Tax=Candidatus Gottesmanbacteria bacterium RIFCSPLOWO2_01_FULL_42_22 TaxID=1798391 RepID=A0A1F6B9I8_9BACT|nr:MAG: Methyltransferase [Candidatus Gottesmanbacteria bacterium GW2011_GWC2_42_8]OGG10264.1 MAG: hypothetical protein A2781_01035 [Candidatus Gottesmanbacteria bacterium RIFCSPHIGHO2_01_FULL_42_27]OGG20295.1 MAG: hypothetical protein A3E72_04160 [Candidatus Gottesmanbacteria bacterium RIFCSPHIGHO2_12_FULL_43_26]OGG33432.1 MAG: hypothetical protein A2968_02575 [Candidatus Gottesmanbacteria bacterium RIFCSPLOWO2_01_FULL_42_22]OGG33836.1 MAG: hypothetical protein A3G68_04655 [Candidatus Gottesma